MIIHVLSACSAMFGNVSCGPFIKSLQSPGKVIDFTFSKGSLIRHRMYYQWYNLQARTIMSAFGSFLKKKPCIDSINLILSYDSTRKLLENHYRNSLVIFAEAYRTLNRYIVCNTFPYCYLRNLSRAPCGMRPVSNRNAAEGGLNLSVIGLGERHETYLLCVVNNENKIPM